MVREDQCGTRQLDPVPHRPKVRIIYNRLQRFNVLTRQIRIAPFPPHWVVNVLCPHVGIGLVPFFISTWLGILGVTVIHTTIGSKHPVAPSSFEGIDRICLQGGLDQMTSAADFHLISWRNFLGLSAVVVAVMIPVGIRWYFRKELQSVAEVEAEAALESEEPQEPDVTKSKRLPPGPIAVFESEDEAYFTPADMGTGIDRKGKRVDKKDWLMESDDDEPLPPPPSRSPRSSSDSDRSSLDMRQKALRTSSSSASSSSAKDGSGDPKV